VEITSPGRRARGFINPWSKLRAKKVEKLYSRHKTASTNDGLPEISKMKYRIPEPGTTISGFADSKKKKN
jgi:hypothetical protein